MKLFADASAMVAIIAGEDDRQILVDRLRAAASLLWSPMSCWETVSALQSSYHVPIEQARERIMGFAEEFGFELVAIGARELAIALNAYQTYGKGRHRAALNFGDCFAYACARANSAALLYKGDDFRHTDLA